MANTKIPVELSSTPGIVDNSNATAITIDSSENSTFSNSIIFSNSSYSAAYSIRRAADALIFSGGTSGYYFNRSDNSATDLYINGSGNVGIGTTSPDKLLHLAASSGATLRLESTTTGASTGDIFGAIEFETQDSNSAGVKGKIDSYSEGGVGNAALRFFTGNTTELGERMRIDSSGNVGIGTSATVTNANLNVSSGINTQSGLVGYNINDSFTLNGGTNPHYGISFAPTNLRPIGISGYYGIAFASSGTERMRIDSSGRVGIAQDTPGDFNAAADDLVIGNSGGDFGITIRTGTASNGSIHFADGTSGDAENEGIITYDHSDDHMHFSTSASEAMRIDSSGNLLVGTTSSSQTSGAGVKLIDDGTNGRVWVQGASQTSGEGFSLHANGSYRFYVAYSGAIASTSTSITAISDERLKENIVDLETGLTEVMSLKPRRFDWKENEGSNEKNVAGFIAQEVETVLPDLISDYKHEDLDDAKSVRMGDMIPTLVKAIQEQQTQIEALQSEINLLKGE